MEDQNTNPVSSSSFRSSNSDKFPTVAVVIAVVILILVIVGGFLIVRSRTGGESSQPESSPIIFDNQPSPSPSAEAKASPEPPNIEKSAVKISVLNGTGIAKEASYLQGILGDLGFEDIDVGNAQEDTHTTTLVYFGEKVPTAYKTEIMKKLEGAYTKVSEAKEVSKDSYDIEITTGTRPGVTKPTSAPQTSASPKPSASPSGQATSSPSPSPSPSASPS